MEKMGEGWQWSAKWSQRQWNDLITWLASIEPEGRHPVDVRKDPQLKYYSWAIESQTGETLTLRLEAANFSATARRHNKKKPARLNIQMSIWPSVGVVYRRELPVDQLGCWERGSNEIHCLPFLLDGYQAGKQYLCETVIDPWIKKERRKYQLHLHPILIPVLADMVLGYIGLELIKP